MHYIGNKSKNEGIKLSSNLLLIDPLLEGILIKYFLSSFKHSELYKFYHETHIKYHETYNYIDELFDDEDRILDLSISLAKHLYKNSYHPQIKSGEFYVVLFRNCLINKEIVNAIGLFKSENKDTFLKIYPRNNDFEIKSEQGININKLDKGCIVFNTKKDNGYLLSIVDNTNKSITNQAQYWVEDFLQIRRYEDSYFQTENILSLCKDFATQELAIDEDISKVDQALFLNKSISFLQENTSFNITEFEKKVFQGTKLSENFQEYKEKYQEEKKFELADEFDISNVALKKQSNTFQSVIKLDKNFHIYIHGDSGLIQQGIDKETGMKYYRFLYNEER
ncbi:MAG: nucleoid-associated protein [Proteocatella sp.]